MQECFLNKMLDFLWFLVDDVDRFKNLNMPTKKGFSRKEPTKKQLLAMPKAKAKAYLAKEKKEKGKDEPKKWHAMEMKILNKKNK